MLRWWAIAFALTLVCELPVYVWGLIRVVGARRAVLVALAANVATHPAVYALAVGGTAAVFVAVEVAAWVAESLLAWALIGRRRPLRDVFLVAFVANALSAGVGLLIG